MVFLPINKMPPTMSKKMKVLTLLGVVYVSSCVMFYYCYSTDKERFKTQLRISRISRLLQGMPSAHGDNGKCLLQKYNLYDASILKYVNEEPTKVDCEAIQPHLTYMDWNGKLFWNNSEIWKFDSHMNCIYQPVLRRENSDRYVSYGRSEHIHNFPIAIKEKTIRVICKRNGIQIYVTIHSQILKPTKQKLLKNKQIPNHKPSVLLLLVDSVSRGQFIRGLPKTYSYLADNKGMIVFEGLNKIGDNTRPNMLALLTGLQYDTEHTYMPHIPKPAYHNEKTIKYDADPLIWKYFGKQGYITLYAEEYIDTIFNYDGATKTMDGFVNEPVDYYFRPNYLALTSNHWSIFSQFGVHNNYCLGNQPTFKYIMNYTEEFLMEMANLKYFALSFFVELSHEKLNDIKNMDNDLFDMFHRLYDKGALDDTIVIVMGDHGHRFSGIRSTPIGRLEERMPFFGIQLPENFKKSYPHIEEGLLSNKNVLLSWYDVHSTLLDILYDNLSKETSRIPKKQEIGSSIFRPVRDNRTCSEIGIPAEYCACGTEKEIPVNLPIVKAAANVLLDNINEKLALKAPFYLSKKGSRCARLELTEIHSATIMASWHRFDERDIPINIRVVITSVPGHAKFEGAVEYKENMEEMHVIGDINRINIYGNQSSCIGDTILRLYCFCI